MLEAEERSHFNQTFMHRFTFQNLHEITALNTALTNRDLFVLQLKSDFIGEDELFLLSAQTPKSMEGGQKAVAPAQEPVTEDAQRVAGVQMIFKVS